MTRASRMYSIRCFRRIEMPAMCWRGSRKTRLRPLPRHARAFSGASTPFGTVVLPSGLPLALPDQDQAERGQRRAVAGPLDLPDHEARLRPVDHAGALTDPE